MNAKYAFSLAFFALFNGYLSECTDVEYCENHVKKRDVSETQTIYDFTVKDIDGNDVSLDKYKDHVVLIVNVASDCGYTSTNYPALEELYNKYKERKFAILAFPCNQFGSQEPGTNQEIKNFVKRYPVTFDMFSKIDVNGNNEAPLYNYLKKIQGGYFGNAIKWNFTKFLINRNGIPVSRYAPTKSFTTIENNIKELL
ncbi:hypothetical protein LAZ67_6000308 [Cordylochernes scorpioides]|uniref:Glutathione peroxidase n=1 Tax=Cordylochernes scorpioides TaxID=51811 RepID=A0ABY6KII0_9ARAC|nr:hypothetical protein LAZ67_6000304 [Cordylochernes scorpioides]UYV68640.1 hypothetical protein LAZ67_6000308 [Cordylochernes scorpioides]